MARTYYDVLGVSVRATKGEIKSAFREKAKLAHPDTIQAQTANLNPYAAARLKETLEQDFREITEAYEVLSDARKRREYDEFLQQIAGSQTASPGPSHASATTSSQAPNVCPTCANALVGNHCQACAKKVKNDALWSGVLATIWGLASIFAISSAVTIPRVDSWDADVCAAILVFIAFIFLLVGKSLWHGMKRLCRTHPRIGAITSEAILLILLSLAVGAFNKPPSKAASMPSTSQPSRASISPSQVPPPKSSAPERLASTKVETKKDAAGPLKGEFGGAVTNQTFGKSADFGILVKDNNGKLTGCMVVNPPLFGSGLLSGTLSGPNVSFVVLSSIGGITFSGERHDDTIEGKYVVRHLSDSREEDGTFTLRRVNPGTSGYNFSQTCPEEEPSQSTRAPMANLYEAPCPVMVIVKSNYFNSVNRPYPTSYSREPIDTTVFSVGGRITVTVQRNHRYFHPYSGSTDGVWFNASDLVCPEKP